RTSLSLQDMREGAIDTDWFQRVHAALGPKRWQALAEAAACGDTRGSAQKVQYLSDVLRGKARKRDLADRVRRKRAREAVRLVGLLPLAAGDRREADLFDRYRMLQEYRRYANALGKSKPDALRAADLGLENLARTAGYPEPIRLEWAM